MASIGISTFSWADNYGAVIQAHALQSFLASHGHDVRVLDLQSTPAEPTVRRWFSSSPRGLARKWEDGWRRSLFERFRRKHLRRSEPLRSRDELDHAAARLDVLIAGSDQVWNPQWILTDNLRPDFCFLRFGPSSARRVSYAASFGHSDVSTLRPDWLPLLSEWLRPLDAISVREPSGVDLVRALCGRSDAVAVVDPTLLPERAHYEQLAGPARAVPGRDMFVYMLHGQMADADSLAGPLSAALGLRTRRCDAHRTAMHPGHVLPDPPGWLRRIRDAGFVVTNSFHGVVFCLIFHTPFVALLADAELSAMNARLQELLGAVGLNDRILRPGQGVSPDWPALAIDWAAVDAARTDMRRASIAFLAGQGLLSKA